MRRWWRRDLPATVSVRHERDKQLAAQFDELEATALTALRRVDEAAATGDLQRYREASAAADRALLAAAAAAVAAQRAAAGPRAYEDRIARRKAQARPEVRRWAHRSHELLTLRERLLLRTLATPGAVPIQTAHPADTAATGPRVAGLRTRPGSRSWTEAARSEPAPARASASDGLGTRTPRARGPVCWSPTDLGAAERMTAGQRGTRPGGSVEPRRGAAAAMSPP